MFPFLPFHPIPQVEEYNLLENKGEDFDLGAQVVEYIVFISKGDSFAEGAQVEE